MVRATSLVLVAVIAACTRSRAPSSDAAQSEARMTDAQTASASIDARSPDAKNEWRDVPGAADFAEPNGPRVILEVRQSGGSGCGGGGCSSNVDARALGLLPAKSFGYYWPDPDRLSGARACPNAPELATLFDVWTAITIAPAKGTEEERPTCGLTTMDGAKMKYWVILRMGAVNP